MIGKSVCLVKERGWGEGGRVWGAIAVLAHRFHHEIFTIETVHWNVLLSFLLGKL